MADPHTCIDQLNSVRGVEPNSWLTDEQEAQIGFGVMSTCMAKQLYWLVWNVFHDDVPTWKRFLHHCPLIGKSTGLLVLCEESLTFTVGFPSQRANFYVFFVVNLKELLRKQSSWLWFSVSWRSCDATVAVTPCIRWYWQFSVQIRRREFSVHAFPRATVNLK